MLYVSGQGAGSPKDAVKEQLSPIHAIEHLEKINWANNQILFLSGISHMFKNPINSIQLGSELLINYVEDMNDQYDELNDEPERLPACFREAGLNILCGMQQVIKGISTSSLKLNQFVSLLSAFTGRGSIADRCDVDLNQLSSLWISMIQHHICTYTNHFSLDIESDFPVLSCSSQKILQVIQNLLMNALLSLPDRSCAVVLSASCNRATGCVQICVRDEGVGISPDTYPRILEPYFSTWAEHGCIGLGLTVTDRIIREYGGELSIDSELGKGTSVRVSLPLEDKTDDFKTERNHA